MVTLTIWDSRADPPDVGDLVYRWSGYEEMSSFRSLLRYVEVHDERLRRRYTAWIHDLGESQINSESLIRHLAIEDGLSYWWMTLLAQQSHLQPEGFCLASAMRLLALEEIIAKQKPDRILLVSDNRRVCQVLKDLCQKMGIAFEWKRPKDSPRRRFNVRGIYEGFPPSIQAIISLLHYLSVRWPFRQMDELRWFAGPQALFICSYFQNFDPKAAAQGRFDSYYWTRLPDLLNRIGHQTNWLQMFGPCSLVPNASSALTYVRRFNEKKRQQGSHTFLNRYLSWRLVVRVLWCWLRLNLASRRLGGIKRAFCPKGSQLSFWPLMRRSWLASTRGRVAMQNVLSVELFDAALRDLPHQKTGLYLCENQAWERAFVYAWRKHAHGRLIAVAHTTIRFWDLRYFMDGRTLRSTSPYAQPRADVLAVNGKSARRHLSGVGFREGELVDVEALRYGYMNDIRASKISKWERVDSYKVLILGEYNPAITIKMLRLFEAANPEVLGRVSYTIKPHPTQLIDASDYPPLNLRVVLEPLGEILQDFDVVCSGSHTSAAADAYFAGLPLIVLLDESELNLCVLRDQPGVHFVSTSEELAEALRTVPQDRIEGRDQNDFFFLDPELPRWSRLLES